MALIQPQPFDARIAKPQRYTCVRLIFEDGTTAGGVWTGKEWWSNGRRVLPKEWQRFAISDPAGGYVDHTFDHALRPHGAHVEASEREQASEP